MATTRYDTSKVTDTQLAAMAKLLGYVDSIAIGASSWGLQALTVAHGIPATHSEAVALANTLGRKLSGSPKLTLGPSPRLHYSKSEGVASIFRTGYHPRRFGLRTRKGSEWSLVCDTHSTSYDKCTNGCKVGVQFNGHYLIDIVRKARPTKASKATVAAKANKLPAKARAASKAPVRAVAAPVMAKAAATSAAPNASLNDMARADAIADMQAIGLRN